MPARSTSSRNSRRPSPTRRSSRTSTWSCHSSRSRSADGCSKPVRSSFLSLLVAAFAVGAAAQVDAPVIPQQPLVTLNGSIQQRSGDEVRGVITAAILSGWHITSAYPLESFAIPTELSLDPATADLVRADFPPHIVRSFTFSGGTKLAVYEGTIRIPFGAKLKSGASKIGVSLHYQACNDTVCLPPRHATLVIPTLSASEGKGAGGMGGA